LRCASAVAAVLFGARKKINEALFEIRQIEPGLYLGKVYWEKKRLIDFALKF